jgi:hypothetical protein
MVSWGSPNTGAALDATDHAAMGAALVGFDVLTVFPGTVVVTIQAEAQRIDLQTKLMEASGTLAKRPWVLISPAMNGGAIYRGLVARDLWPELNKRTT